MVKLTEKQFKEYAKANPENIALIRKNNMNLMLISDIECCENNCLFRIEQMSFKLDIEIAFLESMVDCRGYYAGGITYIFEEGQSFSVCGNQKGFKDARGNLFFEIMRIADELQPPTIFLENVANLTEHDNGRTFNVIHNELASRDYFVRYLIADACDYGIPQHRTRTYIVAFKSKEACDKFKFPEKCKLEKRIFDIIDKTQKADDKYYLSVDSPEYKKLNAAMKDSEQIYRFSDYGIQSSKDRICFTLKANMGTWRERIPFIKDNYGIRKITPQECLALMGFSKEYSFPDIVLQKEQYKQCGNSVTVLLIENIISQNNNLFHKTE